MATGLHERHGGGILPRECATGLTPCDLIDVQVGRLLEALERTGVLEHTLVIFMSDHGELLGDHGIYPKGPFFYEPAVRVPLIVSCPGRVVAGRSAQALVELVDLVRRCWRPPGCRGEPRNAGAIALADADRPGRRPAPRRYRLRALRDDPPPAGAGAGLCDDGPHRSSQARGLARQEDRRALSMNRRVRPVTGRDRSSQCVDVKSEPRIAPRIGARM